MSKDSLSVALSDIHLAKLRNFDLVDTSLDVLLKKFEYLHKLSKTDASGKEIHEFLSTNNLLNSDQNLFLDKHCQRCTPYSLYVNRIETESSQSVDSQFMINCQKQLKTESECRGIEKSNQKFERDMDEILNDG